MLATSVKMAEYIGKRKHSSQMTDLEIKNIFLRLKSVEENGLKWSMATHCLDRIHEKGINADYFDIISSVWNAEMVEYKIDKNRVNEPDERVVIRSKATVNRRYNLHIVFSLTERRIITVWLNNINDRHSTLDWSIYSGDMPIFNI